MHFFDGFRSSHEIQKIEALENEDVQHLINVLNKLVDKGNTVVIIEHHMDVIKVADHIIDVGVEVRGKE